MANPWAVIDRPVIDVGTGAEMIARAAAAQIDANLERQCEYQELLWKQRDADWATTMRKPSGTTRITRVPTSSIYTGARPSLVESRFDLWPAITVRCGNRNPSDDREQPDQYDSLDLELIVEVLAMAGPFLGVVKDRDPDDEIDRQYQRLSDAVQGCISLDKTLNQNILPIKRPPKMTPSLPFAHKLEQGGGEELLFQGMELLYIVTKLLR